MVSKTRERLIEVAKQLFAYKGVENTTMNDIAAASEKGRRTIYTYFKNKREIYNAVVEQQGTQIVSRLKTIVASPDLNNTEKLRAYMLELFDIMSQSTPRPEGYKRLLLRDHKRINRIYKVAHDNEKAMLEQLLMEGVTSGEFDPQQALRLPSLISFALSSAVFYHSEDAGELTEQQRLKQITDITDFVVNGVITSPDNNQHNSELQ
ncbi:MAG: TetR/AcrR family transcriptional regulator [Firmicutes bacterium]|nr:TetR/AcrR family transcriptional regulator [Bacillota bacterium]MCM1400828.1 TetR/AcrR family transcriptional regulator [Bacteroides sp.]MCM1476681.1 TetR/AcrR family transcriptional regulator [Bacteroides sp.]